jgi:RimJ/RimL family protein N-acetyltransferase
MKMARFDILQKINFDDKSKDLFAILAANMSAIAPTGNSYEEDYTLWYDAVRERLTLETRNIILIYAYDELVGFFQYYMDNFLFVMEEIQIAPEFQGLGLFRKLYGFMFEVLPADIKSVRAYANKFNHKSQAILFHLGLSVESMKRNGFVFRGDFSNLLKWYNGDNKC